MEEWKWKERSHLNRNRRQNDISAYISPDKMGKELPSWYSGEQPPYKQCLFSIWGNNRLARRNKHAETPWFPFRRLCCFNFHSFRATAMPLEAIQVTYTGRSWTHAVVMSALLRLWQCVMRMPCVLMWWGDLIAPVIMATLEMDSHAVTVKTPAICTLYFCTVLNNYTTFYRWLGNHIITQ